MIYPTAMPLLSGLVLFSLSYINQLALKSARCDIFDDICGR